jgi:hypothetical protein
MDFLSAEVVKIDLTITDVPNGLADVLAGDLGGRMMAAGPQKTAGLQGVSAQTGTFEILRKR